MPAASRKANSVAAVTPDDDRLAFSYALLLVREGPPVSRRARPFLLPVGSASPDLLRAAKSRSRAGFRAKAG